MERLADLAPSSLFQALLGFAVALGITGLAAALARRLSWVSHPVERSSHSVPTPQVGGIGLCAALLTGLALLLAHEASPSPTRALLAVLAWGFVVGLYDDLRAMAALPKLGALIVLAALGPALGLRFFAADAGPVLSTLGFALSAAWLLFFVNAFNFMDGTNGQSAAFTLNAMLWYGLIARGFVPDGALAAVVALCAGAVLGFVPWNFPRAATFMGDSGSLPLGALIASLLVVLNRRMAQAPGEALTIALGLALPLSVYIYDVLYTLVRRWRRGENLLRAHRSHLYQRLLVATGWSHARLLALHLPLYLATGALGWLYVERPIAALRVLCLGATALILFAYTLFVRRWEERHPPGNERP